MTGAVEQRKVDKLGIGKERVHSMRAVAVRQNYGGDGGRDASCAEDRVPGTS